MQMEESKRAEELNQMICDRLEVTPEPSWAEKRRFMLDKGIGGKDARKLRRKLERKAAKGK